MTEHERLKRAYRIAPKGQRDKALRALQAHVHGLMRREIAERKKRRQPDLFGRAKVERGTDWPEAA